MDYANLLNASVETVLVIYYSAHNLPECLFKNISKMGTNVHVDVQSGATSEIYNHDLS